MPDVERVLIADHVERACVDGVSSLGCEVIMRPELEAESIARAVSKIEPAVLVVRSAKVPDEAFGASDDLKMVIRAGSGFDNINLQAASDRGIAVCNCPGMNADAVAELTLGHLIALDRRIPEQVAALARGEWRQGEFGNAQGLKARSILVIGVGSTGVEVLRRAQAFGMDVWAQSRSLTEDVARALGVRWIPFGRDALLENLARFDAVTLHVPITSETRGMCDAVFFESMRPGAMFINTSRGEIVDERALLDAARAGQVRAAVDVYRDQPASKHGSWSTPLAGVDGLHTTHHVGASTQQAQLAVAREIVRMVRVYRDSGVFEHCVNNVRGPGLN